MFQKVTQTIGVSIFIDRARFDHNLYGGTMSIGYWGGDDGEIIDIVYGIMHKKSSVIDLKRDRVVAV
jgi:hypothetical protein